MQMLPHATRILTNMLISYEYSAYRLRVPLRVQRTPGPSHPLHWLILGPSGTGKRVFSARMSWQLW